MNRTEFLELLNLYLDHQIGEEDAARLETAIQRNREYRQLYRQYCHMEKACGIYAEQMREQAPATARRVVERKDRRATAWYAGLGTLAAAASVALVLAYRAPGDIRPASTAVNSSAQLAEPTSPWAAPAAASYTLNDVNARLPSSALPASFDASLLPRQPYTAMQPWNNAEGLDESSADPWGRVQVVPARLSGYTLQVRPVSLRGPDNAYFPQGAFQGTAEMTGFQFRR